MKMKDDIVENNKLFAKLLQKIDSNIDILPDKEEENIKNTLMALWHKAGGNCYSSKKASDFALPSLNNSQKDLLSNLIKTRLEGKPLAHLTGRQSFMGIEYKVDNGIYIPRKETELLGKTVLNILNDKFENEKLIMIDICTGIGTLAIATAYYNKMVTVLASDISEKAIELAKQNSKILNLGKSIDFFHGSLFDPYKPLKIEGKVNVICSAPPYISDKKIEHLPNEIKKHEPENAFRAGSFGLDIFNEIIKLAHIYLKAGGYLIFEVGVGQGAFLMKKINKNQNYSNVESVYDQNNDIRVLIIQK